VNWIAGHIDRRFSAGLPMKTPKLSVLQGVCQPTESENLIVFLKYF